MGVNEQVQRRGVLKGSKPVPEPEPKEYDPGITKPDVVDLSTVFPVSPFIVYTHPDWVAPEGFATMSDEEKVEALLENEDNIVVGVGKLNLKALTRFSKRFKCDIQRYVARILAVGTYDALGPDIVTDVSYDDVAERYLTPYGPIKGTAQEAAIDIVTFLLSMYGRIIAVDSESVKGFTFEPIDEETILEHLDASLFSQLDSEDSVSPWMTLLERTHTFIRSKAESSEAEKKEQEEMDEKKSLTPSSDADADSLS